MGLSEKTKVIVAAVVAMFVALNATRNDRSSSRWLIVLGVTVAAYILADLWRKRERD